MGLPSVKKDRVYTYGDYRNWPDDERWELIDGTAWNMSPGPNRRHQGITVYLEQKIGRYLEGKECMMYHAPFDVLLPAFGESKEDEVTTVVQPDISVICDRNKLTDKGCTGAPDWIIEIISPYTSRKDIAVKFDLYERHGVREYWIVEPAGNYIHIFVLGADGKYPENPEIRFPGDSARSTVLDGLVIDTSEVFRAE